MWHYVFGVLNVQSDRCERGRGLPAIRNTRQASVNKGRIIEGRSENRGRQEVRKSGRRAERTDDVLRQLPRGQVVAIGTNQETQLRKCTNNGGRAVTPMANSTAMKATPATARAAQQQPSGQVPTAGKPKPNPTATRSLKGQRATQASRYKHRNLHFILPVRNGARQPKRSRESKRRADGPSNGSSQEDSNSGQKRNAASREKRQRQLGGSSSKGRKKEQDAPSVLTLKQPQQQEQNTERVGAAEMANGAADGPAGGGEDESLGRIGGTMAKAPARSAARASNGSRPQETQQTTKRGIMDAKTRKIPPRQRQKLFKARV